MREGKQSSVADCGHSVVFVCLFGFFSSLLYTKRHVKISVLFIVIAYNGFLSYRSK